jgi:nucleotide-binding universal stress UspA family protein
MRTSTAPRIASSPSTRSVDETTEPIGPSSRPVLVAVGNFDEAHSAVKLGAALARERGTRAYVVHVTEREFFGRGGFDVETASEARRLVAGAVSDLEREGVEASGAVVRVIAGKVAEAILEQAANVGANEIVLGAKRSGGIFSRRTRERLLRRSSLPVLVAPALREGPGRGALGTELGRRRAA